MSQQNFHNNLDAKSQLAKALVKNTTDNKNTNNNRNTEHPAFSILQQCNSNKKFNKGNSRQTPSKNRMNAITGSSGGTSNLNYHLSSQSNQTLMSTNAPLLINGKALNSRQHQRQLQQQQRKKQSQTNQLKQAGQALIRKDNSNKFSTQQHLQNQIFGTGLFKDGMLDNTVLNSGSQTERTSRKTEQPFTSNNNNTNNISNTFMDDQLNNSILTRQEQRIEQQDALIKSKNIQKNFSKSTHSLPFAQDVTYKRKDNSHNKSIQNQRGSRISQHSHSPSQQQSQYARNVSPSTFQQQTTSKLGSINNRIHRYIHSQKRNTVTLSPDIKSQNIIQQQTKQPVIAQSSQYDRNFEFPDTIKEQNERDFDFSGSFSMTQGSQAKKNAFNSVTSGAGRSKKNQQSMRQTKRRDSMLRRNQLDQDIIEENLSYRNFKATKNDYIQIYGKKLVNQSTTKKDKKSKNLNIQPNNKSKAKKLSQQKLIPPSTNQLRSVSVLNNFNRSNSSMKQKLFNNDDKRPAYSIPILNFGLRRSSYDSNETVTQYEPNRHSVFTPAPDQQYEDYSTLNHLNNKIYNITQTTIKNVTCDLSNQQPSFQKKQKSRISEFRKKIKHDKTSKNSQDESRNQQATTISQIKFQQTDISTHNLVDKMNNLRDMSQQKTTSAHKNSPKLHAIRNISLDSIHQKSFSSQNTAVKMKSSNLRHVEENKKWVQNIYHELGMKQQYQEKQNIQLKPLFTQQQQQKIAVFNPQLSLFHPKFCLP